MASIKDIHIGGSAEKPSRGSAKANSNTEKELQRLRRMDLLELLLDEIRQNEENAARLKEITEVNDLLKSKLEDKDAQLERLIARLDEKDAEIARLQSHNEAVAHANGTLDVDELLKVQRMALDAYLSRVPLGSSANSTSASTAFQGAAHARWEGNHAASASGTTSRG